MTGQDDNNNDQSRIDGLLSRINEWLTTLRWKPLLYTAAGGLLVLVFQGIIEGFAYDIWQDAIIPWLRTEIKTNYFVMGVAGLGWAMAFFVYFLGRSDRRKIASLEFIRHEHSQMQSTLLDLKQQLGEVNSELRVWKNYEPELDYRRKQARLLDLVTAVDSELLHILTIDGRIGTRQAENYVMSVLRRVCDLFGRHHIRACVYVPDPADPNSLLIRWSKGAGDDSRRFNRWYIGDEDPEVVGKIRGIPGSVWVRGEGRVREHVRDDPDFHDPHEPPRGDMLPYDSILQAIIFPDDKHRKLGILALDSNGYTFTNDDLKL